MKGGGAIVRMIGTMKFAQSIVRCEVVRLTDHVAYGVGLQGDDDETVD